MVLPQIAKAFIYNKGEHLLQLRDNIPSIAYPGYWSFFGGGIEVGETPWQALQRELVEEIEWLPKKGDFLYEWYDPNDPCIVHFFFVPFSGKRNKLVLHEGQGLGWFTLKDLKRTNFIAPHVEPHLIRASQLSVIRNEP